MAFRKIVPQNIQDGIKKTIGLTVSSSNPEFDWDEEAGKIRVNDQYEVLMVVIPTQSSIHSEVRNG